MSLTSIYNFIYFIHLWCMNTGVKLIMRVRDILVYKAYTMQKIAHKMQYRYRRANIYIHTLID